MLEDQFVREDSPFLETLNDLFFNTKLKKSCILGTIILGASMGYELGHPVIGTLTGLIAGPLSILSMYPLKYRMPHFKSPVNLDY